jgi:hypothetical protein
MTTTIKISAHCSKEKEVIVEIVDLFRNPGDQQVELIRMNDGDVADRVVFDGRILTVKEVFK